MAELVKRLGPRGLPYQVSLPEGYHEGATWPVILFLHGAGERGDDGHLQTTVGIGPALRAYPERYPAIVVMPQAPTGGSWRGATLDGAMATLHHTLAEQAADVDRVYLTGVSMGGNGAWSLMRGHASTFAALVPICGWVSRPDVTGGVDAHLERLARRVGDTPTWIFHGADDTVVRVEESRRAAAVLERNGCDVRYTEFAGVRHNSWDQAYAMPELAAWLFAQRRHR